MQGTFIISVDFEIHWGVLDTKTLKSYGENLRGVRAAIDGMLDLFDKYNINVTFATVGMLYYQDKKSLLAALPARYPGYENENLNPYIGISELIGENEEQDPYHFGRSVLDKIIVRKRHELGSHTFSHFYCLEKGQTIFEFEEDLAAFRKASALIGTQPQSLVFPRNQLRYNYIKSIQKFGYKCYRGNENSWVHRPHIKKQENILRRGIRFMDAYFNLTGDHIYTEAEMAAARPFNLKASRFLRPYVPVFSFLEPLKIRRIRNSMTAAAKSGSMYHLWWHPHNFGSHIKQNLHSLETILKLYQQLQQEYGYTVRTMSEFSDFLEQKYYAKS